MLQRDDRIHFVTHVAELFGYFEYMSKYAKPLLDVTISLANSLATGRTKGSDIGALDEALQTLESVKNHTHQYFIHTSHDSFPNNPNLSMNQIHPFR